MVYKVRRGVQQCRRAIICSTLRTLLYRGATYLCIALYGEVTNVFVLSATPRRCCITWPWIAIPYLSKTLSASVISIGVPGSDYILSTSAQVDRSARLCYKSFAIIVAIAGRHVWNHYGSSPECHMSFISTKRYLNPFPATASHISNAIMPMLNSSILKSYYLPYYTSGAQYSTVPHFWDIKFDVTLIAATSVAFFC